jgi:hypothetical protein
VWICRETTFQKAPQPRHNSPWLFLTLLGADPVGSRFRTMTVRDSHPTPLPLAPQSDLGEHGLLRGAKPAVDFRQKSIDPQRHRGWNVWTCDGQLEVGPGHRRGPDAEIEASC